MVLFFNFSFNFAFPTYYLSSTCSLLISLCNSRISSTPKITLYFLERNKVTAYNELLSPMELIVFPLKAITFLRELLRNSTSYCHWLKLIFFALMMSYMILAPVSNTWDISKFGFQKDVTSLSIPSFLIKRSYCKTTCSKLHIQSLWIKQSSAV